MTKLSISELRSALHRALPSRARDAGRASVQRIAKPIRSAGMIPTGLLSMDDLLGLRLIYPNCDSSLDLVEHDWTNPMVAQSPHEIVPRPVRTAFVLIECSGQDGWRFDLNHLITPDNKLAAESNLGLSVYPASLQRLSRSPRSIIGTSVYLSNSWPTNYSHWTLFVMPLIERYRDHLGCEPDWYYVGEPLKSWQAEMLTKAGVDLATVLHEPVQSERMLTVCAIRYGRAVDAESAGFVRSLYTTDAESSEIKSPGPKRIYLERGLATTRRFLNEDECFAALQPLGFESVSTAGLTMDQERDLFAKAEVIVSCHGSGLTNLIFTPEQVLVVELFPFGLNYPARTTMCELAASINARYVAIEGDDLKVDRKQIDLDLQVDPDVLVSVVQDCLGA